MNAKEAREYAKKQMSVVEGKNVPIFNETIGIIKKAIEDDPTKSYISVESLPKQVIGWLENAGYETASYQVGPNETGLKISWSEEGIKMYNHYDK